MAEARPAPPAGAGAWLVLFYQLPAKHSPARVKAWRRLQRIGAVTLKNSAYVLPNSAEAREDFEWIKTEIISIGGQAMVLTAETLDLAGRQDIIELFRTARGHDFHSIRDEAQTMLERWRSKPPRGSARRRLVQSVRRLRERFQEVEGIDFFDAPHRNDTAELLNVLDHHAKRGLAMGTRTTTPVDALKPTDYQGRVWLTRSRPGVDRMSSAWLIRRFIDSNATFVFGDAPSQASNAVPFDMFGAQFGHRGSSCTFETIASRFAIDDPAVAWLGRIVHDLDLKEDTYGVPEKDAVGRMVDGLRRMYHDDQTLLGEGITMFEALYQSYEGRKGEPPASRLPKKRRKARRR